MAYEAEKKSSWTIPVKIHMDRVILTANGPMAYLYPGEELIEFGEPKFEGKIDASDKQ